MFSISLAFLMIFHGCKPTCKMRQAPIMHILHSNSFCVPIFAAGMMPHFAATDENLAELESMFLVTFELEMPLHRSLYQCWF